MFNTSVPDEVLSTLLRRVTWRSSAVLACLCWMNSNSKFMVWKTWAMKFYSVASCKCLKHVDGLSEKLHVYVQHAFGFTFMSVFWKIPGKRIPWSKALVSAIVVSHRTYKRSWHPKANTQNSLHSWINDGTCHLGWPSPTPSCKPGNVEMTPVTAVQRKETWQPMGCSFKAPPYRSRPLLYFLNNAWSELALT